MLRILKTAICIVLGLQAMHATGGSGHSQQPVSQRPPLQEYRAWRLQQHLKDLEATQNQPHWSASAPMSNSGRYQGVVAYLEQLHAQYPDTTELFDLGLNDDGAMIKGIRVGNGNLHNLVVATHHGNEYGSTEVAKALAAALAKDPIQNQSIFIIPVLNINGYDVNRRNETANGRSHDPNRDYEGPCTTDQAHQLQSTRLVAELLEQQNIVTVLTLHTFFPAIAYPWGVTSSTTQTDDHAFFEQFVQLAATGNNYYTGTSTDVIYPADGTLEDYAYWKHGIWSLLYEIGRSHSPTPEGIETAIQETLPGMRLVFENSPTERSRTHEFRGSCAARETAIDYHIE